MTSRCCRNLAAICFCLAITLTSSTVVIAGTYSPCRVPPVVSQATKPNVMIVMDYSGSMQFPAYFDYDFSSYYSASSVAYESSSSFGNTTATYDPTFQYYGTFEPDTYYVYDTTGDYFKAADSQPVLYCKGTAETSDAGSGAIWLTCDGHDFAVGDYVAVYDLGSHKSLNGDGHEVLAVSGSKFKITATWNGTPDPVGYKAIKRITGNTSVGISGNVLNLAITSRTDAALKALIGGKATCDGTYCYLQCQGARRYVSESTNVNAAFYVRPATLASSSVYPNDYSTASYTDKDIFVTIAGRYSGQIDTNDPLKSSVHMEPWKLTLTRSATVTIKVQGTWASSKGCLIYVYSDSGLSSSVTSTSSSSSNTVTLTATLTGSSGGTTYYLRVGPKTDVTGSYSYDIWSTAELEKYTGLHSSATDHQGTALTKIGAIPWARARIQVANDDRTGLIQEAFPYLRIGFMYYKGVTNYKGKILVGCNNTDVDALVGAFGNVIPYNGTPTGPAIQEAYDYLRQTSTYSNADNSAFISKGSLIDPYYGTDATGSTVAVPCRKSFVLLLSDGEWNDGVDPVTPAAAIHRVDLRSELDGDQTGDIYSIFAFSQEEAGENSMKAIAMYGAFNNMSVCGSSDTWPYPMSAVPSSSLTFTWPVSQCDPDGNDCAEGTCSGTPYYNTTCCKEWDSVWDRDDDGANENKGLPDAYYKANNGKELQAALEAVFSEVTSRHASASAVATVSQEMQDGDIIVRGVFEAADTEQVDAYLWRGHLEAFSPFTYDNEEKYSFEMSCNSGLLCMDMPGSDAPCPTLGRNCFDAGYILSTSTTPSDRTIFTYDQPNKARIDFTTANITHTMLGVTTDTERDNLINWARGDEVSSLRERAGWQEPADSTKPWRLGDIVYSTPVVLGPPGLGEVSRRDPNVTQFYEHRNCNITRKKVVYVGANDGMLHAFVLGKYDSASEKWIYDPDQDAEIGKELWAYIPSNLLTELKALADTTYGRGGCSHRSMVDLAPRSWEVYIDPRPKDSSGNPTATNSCGDYADAQGRCWRSVIVGGERGGGDLYFALDVTDPDSPTVLWEYSVLKSRVVVELIASTTEDSQCVQSCRAACADTCTTERTACLATCASGSSGRKCRNACNTTYTSCATACDTLECSQCYSTQQEYKAFVPFRDAYDSIKMFPMSWSQPYLGRMKFPVTNDDDEHGTASDGFGFYVGDPDPVDITDGGQPSTFKKFDAPNHMRPVAFMGGGLHVYDKQFDTTPTVDDRFKLALFWPFFLMMDIETGYNLFEYVWPMVVNLNAAKFPYKPGAGDDGSANTIPYAMSNPVALDVWNQNNDVVGDDGFIDRIYVGDMNGYFYGIKFNLDPVKSDGTANSDFGILVDLWPAKPIEINNPGESDMNSYRSDIQPITVGPAATFESGSEDRLRIIFGTGKYEDVYTGLDDKTDPARMSLYNLRDKVELPDVSAGYEVYDSSHSTKFKVLLQRKCMVTSSSGTQEAVTFNSGCTWVKLSDSSSSTSPTTICTDPTDLSTCTQEPGILSAPDCCEKNNDSCSSPCYECVYDLELPTESGYPGERVVGKPLIASGMVFFTTYVPPSDQCDYAGQGYLYVFNVDCTPLSDPAAIVSDGQGEAVGPTGSSSSSVASAGLRLSLGSGVPSQPVLDSKGENVIVQMSDGTLKRISLESSSTKVRGWRVR